MSLEKFHHQFNDAEIVLPKFKHIPVGVVRKVRRQGEAEQIFTVLEAVADDATLEVIDSMNTEEMQEMVAAWQRDSGVTVGESSASAS